MARRRAPGRVEPSAARTLTSLVVSVIIVAAILVVGLSIFGSRFQHTTIYRNLAEILPPVVDMWYAASLGTTILLFGMIGFTPAMKMAAMDRSKKSAVIQISLVVVALILFALGVFLSVASAFVDWPLSTLLFLDRGNVVLGGIVSGSLAIAMLYFATVPTWFGESWSSSPFMRLVAIVVAGVAIAMLGLSIASTQSKVEQTTVIDTSEGPGPSAPNFSVSALLEGLPHSIGPASEAVVSLKFRMTPFDPNETARRYPIALDGTREYSVSADISGTGFDISELPEAVASARPFAVDQLVTWVWNVAPASDTAGSEQLLLVQVFLHDRRTGALVYAAPVVSHRVEVGTPLGLPTWLFSTEVTIGAVIIAVLGGVYNLFFSHGFEAWAQKLSRRN